VLFAPPICHQFVDDSVLGDADLLTSGDVGRCACFCRKNVEAGIAFETDDALRPRRCSGSLRRIQLLALLSPTAICIILGVFLVVYATYCLYKPASLRLKAGASPHWSGAVGFFSTMIGAFCGGPGIVMMAWLQLRAVPKDIARGVAQPFIIFMQIIGLAIFVLQSPSIFSISFFVSVAMLLPMALIGSEIGVKIYAKTSEFNYRKIVMFLLLGSGAALSLKAALG
jgi:uncharacterized membrane protein YfcA